ncbi:MAG TPA: hypothetical protein VFI25_02310 [Planctomycetota bacterium]|nr:hypothetical protein [Planctomycetota bacterium]
MTAPRDICALSPDERKRIFLASLAQRGVVTAAAVEASPGVADPRNARMFFYRMRKEDAVFRHDWEESLKVFVGRLEAEIVRRGLDGWTEDRVVRDARGDVVRVDSVRRYDASLLKLLATRWMPEYGEKVEVKVEGGCEFPELKRISPEDAERLAQVLESIAAKRPGASEV